MTQITFGTIDLNNGESMFYREWGEGDKTIIFIHGNMSSSRHWESLLPMLPQDYRAYAVDLRGMGQSTYHSRFDSLQELAEDVKLFMEKKNLGSVVLVGWSTGGGVALELGAMYPHLVDKIVLVESVGFKGYPITKRDERGELEPGQYYSSKEEMAKDPIQVAPALLAIETRDFDVMKQIWNAAIYVHNKPDPEEYQALLEATFDQRNLLDIDWALANFNLSHGNNGMVEGNGKIDAISMPVLSLWGDSDLVVTRDMVAETVAAIGDNAQMVVLEKCGHSPLVDCPRTLVDQIISFIEK